MADDPFWYKDAVIYELHVRAFADGNGDGAGDFVGLTRHLDYIADLGVTVVWLLPFYPSPLRDDGYDIADYTTVHPSYGTLDDFKAFLDAAHARGLKVVTELVINHTSDQHPWFQRARRSPPGSPERDFYVWSDTPEKYAGVRVVFQDFEPSNWTWDPLANAYYWHRFYHHQPDLNYDNPAVHDAILPLLDYWFAMGVDGMRLDAVPYLYEREGTSCDGLPETHAFLKKMRKHVDDRFPNRMFLAEANQWPEDAVAYFGDGDECHLAFHFPLMPRLFMAVRLEDRFPVTDIFAQTPAIPESCQWALFLRNHDELTLEMVTDEERDVMYRAYARDPAMRVNLGIRRRLAPLMGNDRRKTELLVGLLCSLPGTPVLYYGDEIGMGDNFYLGDRNGVRTPMQWSADRNAGFSRANPQKLYLPVVIDPEYHYEAVNVDAQQNNPHSLLWWHKRLLAARKRHHAFGRGTTTFVSADNEKVLAFVRELEGECILVVANLSRHAQYAELNLSAYHGLTPVELFGGSAFPPVGDKSYAMSLSPYGFYWLALTATKSAEVTPELPIIRVSGDWPTTVRGPLERLLPAHLARRGWFRGAGRAIHAVGLMEAVALPDAASPTYLAGVRVEYAEGEPEVYTLPMALATGPTIDEVLNRQPECAIARVTGSVDGLIYDAMADASLNGALLALFAGGHRLPGARGTLLANLLPEHAALDVMAAGPPNPRRTDQNRAVTLFGDSLVLTLQRHLEPGPPADWELGRHLAAVGFSHVRPLVGLLEYRPTDGDALAIGVLHTQVPTARDGWQYTLADLSRYFERALSAAGPAPDVPSGIAAAFANSGPAPAVAELLEPSYLAWARLAGQRTAELHAALADAHGDANFTPESMTRPYLRMTYQAQRNATARAWRRLGRRLRYLPADVQSDATTVLGLEDVLLKYWKNRMDRRPTGQRVRIHGDLHLGQLLVTGTDVTFVHFGGDVPASPLERRQKRSVTQDIAGMLRSWQRAVTTALVGTEVGTAIVRPEDRPALEPWGRAWLAAVGAAFVSSYGESPLLPREVEERRALTEAFVAARLVTELTTALGGPAEQLHASLRDLLAVLTG
ncbi:MAG: maltose alpha-D-glucosyltransferase [Gemmataceae bacterium]